MKRFIHLAIASIITVLLSLFLGSLPQDHLTDSIAYILFALCIFILAANLSRMLIWVHASALVTGHVPIPTLRGMDRWKHAVQFDARGETASAVVDAGLSALHPQPIGSRVQLLYPPGRPQNAVLHCKETLLGLPFALVAAGVIFLIAYP